MRYFPAPDGARLAYRDEGAGIPVLALAGLTRTGADFDYLAPHLPDVRLIRPDYRGRGASEWTGPDSYTVEQEAADALALLDHLEIPRAALLGTSRGGLIGLHLAASANHRLAGLCLNDVGPVIETEGLRRISGYIGRNPSVNNHAELAEVLPRVMEGFANVPPARWLEEARKHYQPDGGKLVITYDPALRDAFVEAFRDDLSDAWPQFDAAKNLPLAVIRGANSDLLSQATVAEMQKRRPDMIVAEVPDRAHIPFLDEPEALDAIRGWLDRIAI